MDIKFREMKKALNESDVSRLAPMKFAVLRNVMIEPIEIHLRYLASKIGFNAEIRVIVRLDGMQNGSG